MTMTALQERLQVALADRYRIEGELGAGGMATVFLAHDPRHDRKVAIKLFRPELCAILGAERFLTEITVTGALQHPHILPLYDSGAADSLLYYVMPYVEGESLRQRLDRERQLPVAEAVRIAREVADALDYAHRHGVIHRDVKPENILLHEGRASVADFGIALAVQRAGGARLTETGLSLGTPQYMSPEQATAERDLDARSDIYSLGCVLYEMLTGEPPHSGPTTQAIIARIITERPRPVTDLRDAVPPALADAVHTALARIPADRFPTAAAFSAALERPDGAGSTGMRAAAGSRPQPRRAPVLAALLAATALGLGFLLGRSGTGPAMPEPPPSRLSILSTTVGGSGGAIQGRQVAITPDGSSVLYAAVAAGVGNQVVIQRLDSETAVPVPGGEGLFTTFVSPDGRTLYAGSLLVGRTLSLTGAPPRPSPVPLGTAFAAWHPDGSFWFSPSPYISLERIVPGVDTVEAMLANLPGLRLQQILDDGRTAIVVRAPLGTTAGPAQLLDLRSATTTPLLDMPVVEVRHSAGHLVYALLTGDLWAVAFDARSRRLGGTPVRIATGVLVAGGTGIAQFAVSRNGTLAYIPESPRTLVFVDRQGHPRRAVEDGGSYHAPMFSPDGRRLSVDFSTPEGRDVWVLDIEQRTLSRATFDRDGHDAVWTRDGRALLYTSARSGPIGLYQVRPGSGHAAGDSLFASPRLSYTGYPLPDGSALVTVGNDLRPGTGIDIGIVRNGGRGPIEPLIATPFQEQYPAVSPDGKWLVFVSDQSGRREVYLRLLDGDGDQIQISTVGGDEPVWNPRGGELFYRELGSDDTRLISVRVELTPRPRVVSRTTLFSVEPFLASNPHANYDVSPDGRIFAMVERSQATRLVVLQNLPALVRQSQGAGPGR